MAFKKTQIILNIIIHIFTGLNEFTWIIENELRNQRIYFDCRNIKSYIKIVMRQFLLNSFIIELKIQIENIADFSWSGYNLVTANYDFKM